MARVHYGLGTCLAWWGWNWGAARAFGDATRADATFVDAHYRLGEALGRRGHWVEAGRALREAARLRPADVDVQGSLAFALGKAGRWEEAVATLRRLAHLRPLQAEVHVLVAAIQRLKLRRPEDAIRSYRWAVRLELPPRGVRFHLAEAILGASAWDGALTAFREAKGLEPAPVPGRSEDPGRSILHRHPGGPVAVPLRPRAPARTRPQSDHPLAHGWRRVSQAAAVAYAWMHRGARVVAGAASEAEEATLLHCYRQSPVASDRPEGRRPARLVPSAPSRADARRLA